MTPVGLDGVVTCKTNTNSTQGADVGKLSVDTYWIHKWNYLVIFEHSWFLQVTKCTKWAVLEQTSNRRDQNAIFSRFSKVVLMRGGKNLLNGNPSWKVRQNKML